MDIRASPKCPECGHGSMIKDKQSGKPKCPECGCVIGLNSRPVCGHNSWTPRVMTPIDEIIKSMCDLIRSKRTDLEITREEEDRLASAMNYIIRREKSLIKKDEVKELCASTLYYLAKNKKIVLKADITKLGLIFNISKEKIIANYHLYSKILGS